MDTSDKLGAFRIALILALISAIVSVVPGMGKTAWYVAVPAAAMVLLLGIATLVGGRTPYGFFLIACSLLIPAWCWFAPFISSGKLARLIHGVPLEDPPAEIAKPEQAKPPAPNETVARKRPSEPPETGALFPVDPPEKVAPMFEMREWTSSDGRKMRAELTEVFKNDDGLFTGHFVRDDGKEFDMPIGKLSAEDLAEVKKAMGK